jgi:hypothetical protein
MPRFKDQMKVAADGQKRLRLVNIPPIHAPDRRLSRALIYLKHLCA